MATTVTMPKLGETVTEGTVLRWMKGVGDSIAEDELLFEVSTDKVDSEVPSPVSGVIAEILVPEGDTVAVGTPICVIAEPGEEVGAGAAPESDTQEAPAADAAPAEAAPAEAGAEGPAPVEAEPAEVAPTEAAPPEEAAPAAEAAPEETTPEGGASQEPAAVAPGAAAAVAPAPSAPAEGGDGDGQRRVLSPVVRRLVAENDVDLQQVEGTGEGGRITRNDVLAYLSARGLEAGEVRAPTPSAAPAAVASPTEAVPSAPAAPAAAQAPAASPATAQAAPAASRPAEGAAAPAAGGADETVELPRLRERIAKAMVESKQTSAHVWLAVEVDYSKVDRARAGAKASFRERNGFSLTYLPFVARAVIDALADFPAANASFDLEGRAMTHHRAVNLGIAVDLDQKGLIVPVIHDAADLRLEAIARRIVDLATRARTNKLTPDDVVGSTFSITNPGPYGTVFTAPIINQPNTAILSTDTVKKRAVVVEGAEGDSIAIRPVGNLGLTWDHRAFDGSTAALFAGAVREILETRDWEAELT